MRIGTTPTHVFVLPFSVDEITEAEITYEQNGKAVLTKKTPAFYMRDKVIAVTLTESETFLFDESANIEMQLRVALANNLVLSTGVICISCDECLSNSVLGTGEPSSDAMFDNAALKINVQFDGSGQRFVVKFGEMFVSSNGAVSPEEIKRAFEKYLKEHPPVRIVDVTLLADAWKSETEKSHWQIVDVKSVTENTKVTLEFSKEQLAIFRDKKMWFDAENTNGIVKVWLDGDKPQNDYTAQATLMEVYFIE